MARSLTTENARALSKRSANVRTIRSAVREDADLAQRAESVAVKAEAVGRRVARLSDLTPAQQQVVRTLLAAQEAASKFKADLAHAHAEMTEPRP